MDKHNILNRLFQILITLIGISIITFGLVYLAPGDPVRTMYLSSGSMPSEEVIENTREAMGLNNPFYIQYFNWLKDILQGDFGDSYSLKRPVIDAISTRVARSFNLTMSSLMLTLCISFPLGILSAIYKNKLLDYVVRFYTFIGISIPGFLLGTILLVIIAVKWSLLPVVSNGTGIESLILPSITLAFPMSSKYTRQIRSIVSDELEKDYVLGAKARGIKFSNIILKDVLPNILPPLITLIAISFGSLLSGVAVVEVIFSYPGIGGLAVDAITAYDYPLIQGYVIITSVVYMSVNLIVDISYPFLDPRISKRYT